MGDIVERLRELPVEPPFDWDSGKPMTHAAADEIYALRRDLEASRAEVAALRYALERCPPISNPTLTPEDHLERVTTWWRLWARPALSDHGKGA